MCFTRHLGLLTMQASWFRLRFLVKIKHFQTSWPPIQIPPSIRAQQPWFHLSLTTYIYTNGGVFIFMDDTKTCHIPIPVSFSPTPLLSPIHHTTCHVRRSINNLLSPMFSLSPRLAQTTESAVFIARNNQTARETNWIFAAANLAKELCKRDI